MTIEAVLVVLLYIVIVVALAYAAKYVIDSFFPAPLHTPALILVGIILLILLVLFLLRLMPPGLLK